MSTENELCGEVLQSWLALFSNRYKYELQRSET